MSIDIRHNWTKEEIYDIYNMPLLELVFRAAELHRKYNDTAEVQVCTLLSIKTGGCSEDCAYCPQAARYNTGIDVQALMKKDEVLAYAQKAKEAGSTRFCMGAAWREVRDNRDFDRVLDMVKGVNEMGMEVCCTLGMLTEDQAQKLADAGLYAYNHNLDTSKEHYGEIITTRTYEDRLETLENVRKAGVTVCCGGIIGLGETHEDRIGMLHTLATMPEHPESVPINSLVAIPGTPLEHNSKVDVWDMVRMIATARILMPKTMVRLSAGRTEMSVSDQALCFMAGANSIFAGDKLLTTPNPSFDEDNQMFQLLGLKPRKAFKEESKQYLHEMVAS
ncbi:MAG: biotin synthase BioB [Sediminibacterium sp. Gen4]|jgi:biotin synthase|uniref:biotin synthase BioB n=1 Tax=unclassified Sediminibacterium TaxID=2635961 RepID=UPI0015BC213A|nr:MULTISPECIES: biotin synthase BioB [unclassified Sediminibacterium]MBW0161094.1 biotin synthase BioB [Sediminibacterium sp.]MBW0164734.1 biotin synthase BioB [Sediminibacterium sp.]NWK65948.1 biotin synthase BioB [Sediminibacterium sp. Gen4]